MKARELMMTALGLFYAAIGMPDRWKPDLGETGQIIFWCVTCLALLILFFLVIRQARKEKIEEEKQRKDILELKDRMAKAQEAQAKAQEAQAKAQEAAKLTLEKVTCAECGRLGPREEMDFRFVSSTPAQLLFTHKKGFGCHA